MNTRIDPKTGKPLSILGYGCMRFPTKAGSIDDAPSRALITRAINQGVNYFDTAYIYHAGKSESFLGKVLIEEGLREKVNIATKLPLFMVRSAADIDRLFNTQLKRLQTQHIDYYLLHMLSDTDVWNKLCAFGIEDWIIRKKKSGEIGQIGFSFHGGRRQFIDLLNVYDWEFCQIQYNFLDENNQAGKSGLIAAAEKGLPVIAMEPLRGGAIVNGLPKEITAMWNETGRTAADWGLRWVWNHPQITTLLSGMGEMAQLNENITLASDAQANLLTPAELAMFEKARDIWTAKTRVPCTGCGYCMPCPAGVDIPTCFSAYNEKFIMKMPMMKYMQATGALSRQPAYASKCIQCGKCESHCPQAIPIREKLMEVRKHMEKFPFALAAGLARRMM